ncbi:MAG: hypothetical protein LBS84_04755 [Clostridiales bacterium]|nr:hypothetical protein [Clostridiales bacterium]
MNEKNAAALVLMLKNPETGFFEEELGRYHIGPDEELAEGLYAEETADGRIVCLRVGVGNVWTDISDELFDGIYDSYDADQLPDFVTEFIELDECYTPAWEARFLFSEDPAETEDMIKQALAAHRGALSLLLNDHVG